MSFVREILSHPTCSTYRVRQPKLTLHMCLKILHAIHSLRAIPTKKMMCHEHQTINSSRSVCQKLKGCETAMMYIPPMGLVLLRAILGPFQQLLNSCL